MYSQRPSESFRSSIFKLTLISSAAFPICAMLIVTIMGFYFLIAIEEENNFEIQETMEWLVEGIDEDGLAFLGEELLARHLAGLGLIIAGLVVNDGRLLRGWRR